MRPEGRQIVSVRNNKESKRVSTPQDANRRETNPQDAKARWLTSRKELQEKTKLSKMKNRSRMNNDIERMPKHKDETILGLRPSTDKIHHKSRARPKRIRALLRPVQRLGLKFKVKVP